jgi:hypothetical protein
MCGYKVKKERRRAGDYFISLRVTSDSFFLLASLGRPKKKKEKKKALSPKQKLKRERERER